MTCAFAAGGLRSPPGSLARRRRLLTPRLKPEDMTDSPSLSTLVRSCGRFINLSVCRMPVERSRGETDAFTWLCQNSHVN